MYRGATQKPADGMPVKHKVAKPKHRDSWHRNYQPAKAGGKVKETTISRGAKK